MKRIIKWLLCVMLCLTFSACNKQEETQNVDVDVQEEPSATMANPMVECDSLDDINKKVGVQIVSPGIMGKENEKYFVIDGKIAQYDFDLNGKSFTIRGALITDEDISGIYDDNNMFAANEDSIVYTNDYYLDRFFDYGKQYTIVVKDPTDLDEVSYMEICNELESIMKWHNDDPLVGDYEDSVSQRASCTVERHGDDYALIVNWSTSANENTCWTIYAKKQDDKLTYVSENVTHYVYDDDGNESVDDETIDVEGYFTIKDDKLCWSKASESYLEECVFEKIVY